VRKSPHQEGAGRRGGGLRKGNVCVRGRPLLEKGKKKILTPGLWISGGGTHPMSAVGEFRNFRPRGKEGGRVAQLTEPSS